MRREKKGAPSKKTLKNEKKHELIRNTINQISALRSQADKKSDLKKNYTRKWCLQTNSRQSCVEEAKPAVFVRI